MPNGKKRFWKTGIKPTHPKGKRSITSQMAQFINEHHEAIVNGSSRMLSEGEFFCSSCFLKEEIRLIEYEDEDEATGIIQGEMKT